MCTICDLRIEFSIDHPMTLSVAVATRRAIDAGLLPSHHTKYGGMQLRREAIAALKAVQRRVEQTQTQDSLLALPDFFMLAIESRTWGFFHPTPDGFDPNCRPDPPRLSAEDVADRDPVVIASETAMRQLLAGKLPFSKAEEQGLVVIDADLPRYETLRSTWNAAYPEIGVGNFFCDYRTTPLISDGVPSPFMALFVRYCGASKCRRSG